MTSKINDLLGIRDSYQAPEKVKKILLEWDRKDRDEWFAQLAGLFKNNMSYDWFNEYFQETHADRAVKKQDFTPDPIANLIATFTSPNEGVIYEPAAGTGGIIIKAWHQVRMRYELSDYDTLVQFFVCEELSDRAIPFLLLNMAIRGMNGNVIHMDSLGREAWSAYHVFNECNDPHKFSTVIELPKNEKVEKVFNIKFVK